MNDYFKLNDENKKKQQLVSVKIKKKKHMDINSVLSKVIINNIKNENIVFYPTIQGGDKKKVISTH